MDNTDGQPELPATRRARLAAAASDRLDQVLAAASDGRDRLIEAASDRRNQKIAGVAVGTILAGAVAAYLYNRDSDTADLSAQDDEPEGSPSRGGWRWNLDHPVDVSGHHREQRYGPGRSQVKTIFIDNYTKGPGQAEGEGSAA